MISTHTTRRILICGTRKQGYRDVVNAQLALIEQPFEIIEGCCPISADEWAEAYAEKHNIKVHHYPSTSGNYLKRNIQMVEQATEVYAFWDGFSYGTAHTIAQAVKKEIPIKVISI